MLSRCHRVTIPVYPRREEDQLKEALAADGLFPMIAVHCHNDRGLALANALDAFRAGVDVIDTSVLGLGERSGIVDLATLLAVLRADFGVENAWRLDKLVVLYELVSRYSGVPVPVNAPIVGRNAFTHCAGLHTQAATKNPLHYQSLDPALFGRSSDISLDHMSGSASIEYALVQIGQGQLDAEIKARILRKVKTIGQKGRSVSLDELTHLVRFCESGADAVDLSEIGEQAAVRERSEATREVH